MSDRPDDISKEAWSVGCETWVKLEREHPSFDAEVAVIARVIDQARREGYAAGVRAAAEVADTLVVHPQMTYGSGPQGCYAHAIRIAVAIRALDGKGDGK